MPRIANVHKYEANNIKVIILSYLLSIIYCLIKFLTSALNKHKFAKWRTLANEILVLF